MSPKCTKDMLRRDQNNKTKFPIELKMFSKSEGSFSLVTTLIFPLGYSLGNTKILILLV